MTQEFIRSYGTLISCLVIISLYLHILDNFGGFVAQDKGMEIMCDAYVQFDFLYFLHSN